MDEYLVPCADAVTEFTEKSSRFIGHLFHVTDEQEAQRAIETVKKRYHDARHNCWCYRLHSGAVRYADDGEPQGTAGQPMLNVFERENVEDVCCVVTRYFGGILLGAGGLTRAYGRSAKDALTAGGIAKMCLWQEVRIDCPYALHERVKLLIATHGGIVTDSVFAATVEMILRVPVGNTEAFALALTECSAGALTAQYLAQQYLPGERIR